MNPELLPVFPLFIDISEPHLKKYRILNSLSSIGFKECNSRHLHNITCIFSAKK